MLRSFRHLAAAAIAVMALAMTALPVLAVDEPVLSGTIVDTDGQPFDVESARMTMTAQDGGGLHAALFEVGPDGSFEVTVMPWGTTESPAQITISVSGAVTDVVPNADGCSDQVAPVLETTFDVALEGGGEPDPVELVAEPQVVAVVCGENATPVVTLPPSAVEPATSAPSAEPVIPAGDVSSGPPWLVVILAGLALVAIVGGGLRLAGRRSRR